MGQTKSAYKVLSPNEGKRLHRITRRRWGGGGCLLKCLKIMGLEVNWIYLTEDRGLMAGSCGHGIKTSGFIKCVKLVISF
jgi:hypothetical protein